MSIKDDLNEFKSKLDRELEHFFDMKIKDAKDIDPEAKLLIEKIKDLTLRGGKRIRAALLYYSYIAHGGTDLEKAMRAAMAMEMSESFLLIHDDVIDDDDVRRGGTSIHTSYEKRYISEFGDKNLSPTRFGESFAIMAGDAAHAMANELIATSGFNAKHITRAILEFSQIIQREVFGEILDVLIEVKNQPTRDDVTKVQQLKTAPYTFDSPVKLGAILAGASDEQIKKLEAYTLPLGVAFQIQDDIIGMFGTQEKTGKPILSDLQEGKITLLILDALANCTDKQKDIINQNLGNKNVTLDDLEAVKEVMKTTGALQKSQNEAKILAQNGRDALCTIDLKEEGKNFLLGIAEYIINRDY